MRLRSQRFISPITLWLGNRVLIRSGSQTRTGGPQAGLSVHKVGREALATLFHRLHFGWATGALFVLKARLGQAIRRGSQYIRSATRRLPSLFHRLHFGWATRGLLVLGSQTRAGDPQGQSVHKVGREALTNFISPITLWLGNRLSPPKSQGCERGPFLSEAPR